MKIFDENQGFRAFARGSLVYLPVVLLVGFSLLNFARVRLDRASPWVAGGYGMHSTFDSILFRFVRIYGIDSNGRQNRIKVKRRWMAEPIVSRPVAANAERLVRRMQRRGLMSTRHFEAFRVETWQYTFPSGAPHLGARRIATHRISARP